MTARACVSRIITDLAMIDVTAEGLVLRELCGATAVAEVCAATAAPLIVPPGSLPRY